MFLSYKLGLICKAKKQGTGWTGVILKTCTRFHFSQTKPAEATVGPSLVMQSATSHLRCLHVLYHQRKMSSLIGPTQTAVLGQTMPLNSQWGQQRPVSTFPAGLSLTVGEKGFCPGVSTYVLQLRKQGRPSENRQQFNTACFVLHLYRREQRKTDSEGSQMEPRLTGRWCRGDCFWSEVRHLGNCVVFSFVIWSRSYMFWPLASM